MIARTRAVLCNVPNVDVFLSSRIHLLFLQWLGGEVPTANDTAAVLRLEDLLLQARTATDAGDTLQALCMYTNTVGDVTFSVWFGTLMCVFSLIMCLGAWFIDWFASDRVAAMEAEKERKAVEAGKDPNQKEEAPSILEVIPCSYCVDCMA